MGYVRHFFKHKREEDFFTMAQQNIAAQQAAVVAAAQLKKLGFTRATAKTGLKHRLILSVEGMEKQGKSHFGLTAPAPIGYFDFDTGSEGVVHKFAGAKEIHINDYRKLGNSLDQAQFTIMWERFREQFLGVLANPNIRTVIPDTATEVWELLRMARFGKLTQVMPYHYGPVNAEYREMMRKVYDSDKNLILLHKMKKRYRNDNWDGGYERSGFTDTGYLVQVNAVIERDEEGEFVLMVKDCRQNSAVAGMTFEGPMCNFQFLAASIFPDPNPDDWE